MIKTVTFLPSRIGCPSIPGTVKGIIVSLSGVKDVKVNYEDRSIDVAFDDTAINESAITKKIGEEIGLAFHPSSLDSGDKENVAETCPM